MKKTLLLLIFIAFAGLVVYGQNVKFEVPIQTTGETATDTLDDGTIVTFPLSSDDAEQENDEIDALYDDDIDAGWEGDPEDNNILTAGLRFRDINIPQGATIDSAFVLVVSHEDKSTEDVANITVWAEATDHAETWDEENLIDARTPTTAKIDWVCDEEWIIWQQYSTPDISAVIQEIIDRSGWESGNAIALVFQGEDQGPSDVENAREFEAFENISDPEDVDHDGNPGDGKNHPERVPRLVVFYTAPQYVLSVPIQTTGETATDTLDDGTIVTFPLSSDDAEQENDEIDALYDDDIDAGWEGDPEDNNILTAGLRFRDINIPKGASIDSAFISVVSHEDKSTEDVANITIWAEATDNAETFDEETLIDARTPTSAKVDWVCDEEWIIWETYNTPDLGPIVQEIVNRPGWVTGNAIAFVFQGEDQGPSDVENAREFEAFENISDPEDVDHDGNPGDGKNHPERVPRLTVYFNLGTTSVSKTYYDNSVIRVYPNPATSGIVNLSFSSTGHTVIRVFNVTGQMVKSLGTTSQLVTLNMNDLPQGVYLVKATQGGNTYTEKIILK